MAIPADNSRPAPGAGEGVLSPAPAKSSPGRLMLTEMLAHLVFGKPKITFKKGFIPPPLKHVLYVVGFDEIGFRQSN